MVYVMSIDNEPLMPTKRHGKVRRLLRDKIDVEKSLRKTDPSVRPPWIDENADQINGIISSTIPKNSLVIGTDFYDVQPGGQDRVDLKNKEWVSISSKYTGVNYKYNGDGSNMYLAAHLSPYGKEIRNKTQIYFKDNDLQLFTLT